MPALGALVGEIDLSQLNLTLLPAVTDASGEVTKEAVVIGFGTFLVTIIDFVIIAFVIFAIIKGFNKAKEIAEGMFISSRAVSGSMRKLVSDGYVEKIGADPVMYLITEKGKNINIED
jgi:large conductance mechanosensitive channel protein